MLSYDLRHTFSLPLGGAYAIEGNAWQILWAPSVRQLVQYRSRLVDVQRFFGHDAFRMSNPSHLLVEAIVAIQT